MRMARLLEMIRVIKYHPDWGAKRLAEYFEISEKRIYDDINELNAANIPIVYNGRGYSFLTPPTLVPVQFTVDEAMALMMSGTALDGGRGDAYAAAVRTATTKLLDSLPDDTRQFLLALSGRVRAKGQTAAPDALKKLHRAMADRRTAAFEYASYSSGRRAAREADPYATVFRGNAWYLIGWCHTRKQIRTFRINRMDNIAITNKPFEYPADFSIEQHLSKSWAIFQGDEVEVAVRFSKKIAPLIEEHQWQPDQRIERHADGSITFTTTVRGTLEIRRWILSWGDAAEVLAPVSLRNEIKQIAAELSLVYEKGSEYNTTKEKPIKKVAEKTRMYKSKKD